MKLKVRGNYRNDARGLAIMKGQIIEVEDDVAQFLLTDAPGCFEAVKAKAPDAPPEDKALKGPTVKK